VLWASEFLLTAGHRARSLQKYAARQHTEITRDTVTGRSAVSAAVRKARSRTSGQGKMGSLM